MLNLNAMFNMSSVTPDTSEDIEVNSESLDADYRLNDLSSSINAISSQFSALMSSSSRISDMYSYIRLYGVDRACVQVYNRDGLLTDLSNGVVPATEDFRESNVSKYTIACMEGLGEAIIKIFKWCWEKLKAIGKWIGEKISAACKWILSKFRNNDKNIEKTKQQLAKLSAERKPKVLDKILQYVLHPHKTSASTEDFENTTLFKMFDPHELRTRIKQCIDSVSNQVDISIDRINKVTSKLKNLSGNEKEDFGDCIWDDKENKIDKSTDRVDTILKECTYALNQIKHGQEDFKNFREFKEAYERKCSLKEQYEKIIDDTLKLTSKVKDQLDNVIPRHEETLATLEKGDNDNARGDIPADVYTKYYNYTADHAKSIIGAEMQCLARNANTLHGITKMLNDEEKHLNTDFRWYDDMTTRISKHYENFISKPGSCNIGGESVYDREL